MTRSFWTVSLVVFSGLAAASHAAPPAATETPEATDAIEPSEIADEKSPLTISADLRLRWESDMDSHQPDGTKRDDRDRFRIRARLGASYELSSALRFDARIRTGDHNSQQSPHITLWQDSGDEGEQDDITLDRAFLRWAMFRHTELTAGRTGLMTWRPNEMFWDDDVYVDGVSIRHRFGADQAWTVNAHVALLPDGDASHSFDERSRLAALQLRRDMTCGGNPFVLATTLLYIDDNRGETNRVNDDEDFLFSSTNAQYTLNHDSAVPVKFGADVMVNLHHGPAADHPDDRFGFDLYVHAGRYREAGDWTLGYAFARIERWSVPRFMAQDDWVRWGSATQTRSSDFYGHEFRAGYVVNDHVKLLGRFYVADAITSDEDGLRFRFDVNITF